MHSVIRGVGGPVWTKAPVCACVCPDAEFRKPVRIVFLSEGETFPVNMTPVQTSSGAEGKQTQVGFHQAIQIQAYLTPHLLPHTTTIHHHP